MSASMLPMLSQDTMRPSKWTLPLAPYKALPNEASGNSVGLLSRQEDWECLMLGAFGLSLRAISERTGFTVSQVYYRLGKAKIKVGAYRNGHGPMAKLVIDTVSNKAKQLVQKHVEAVEIEAEVVK